MPTGPSNPAGAPDGSPSGENSKKTCTRCLQRKLLHHFVSSSGNRSFQRCTSCRESDAAVKAMKRLAERSPSSSLRSNIVVGPLQQPSSTTPASSQSYSTGPTTPTIPTAPSLLPRIAPAGCREHREPQFLLRGQNSQDPAEVAEARAERVAIQRQHRAARRHGESPSPTPELPSMVRQRDDGGDGGDDDLSDDVDRT